MKVLIVCQNLGIGGVQKYTHQMYDSLKILGVDVEVKCYQDNILQKYKHIRLTTKLTGQYDYIFLNSYPITKEEILDYKQYTKHIVAICHTDVHIFTKLTCEIIENIHSVISVSQLIVNKLKFNSNIDFKYKIITPCIDEIASSNTSIRINYNLLWCGRITPPKGAHILSRLFKQYIESHPERRKWKLKIYGEPGRPFLKNIIKQYECDNIEVYLEAYNEHDFKKFSKDIDIFINTSYMDGFPYTFLEFLSKNIPIISSNVGGIDSMIVPGKNGDLFNFKGLYVPTFPTGDDPGYQTLYDNFESEWDYNYTIFSNVLDNYLLNVDNLLNIKANCQFNLDTFSLKNMMEKNLKDLLNL